MGNICSRLCNQSDDTENNENNEGKSFLKPGNHSLIQNKIRLELRRASGVHFNELKFNKNGHETQEEAAGRSKENIKQLYKFDHEIGEGGFGYVCKATLKKNPKKNFAVKVIKKKDHKIDLAIFLKEIELMKVFDHPYIVKFYEVYEDKKCFYLVLECLEGGELLTKIEEEEKMEEKDIKHIFWQMVLAVNYLHRRRIAHRDLKPENFLFKHENGKDIKLIDFGLSQNFKNIKKMKTIAGSPYYLSPEILEKNYTKKCDVWSLGVILYEMITKELPFSGENNNQVFQKITTGRYDTKLLERANISDDLIDLVKKMIVVGEGKRISMDGVINHQWFKEKIERIHTTGKALITPEILTNLKKFTVSSNIQRELIGLMLQAFQDEEEVEEIKKIFMAIDDDQSGTIQKPEIKALFEENGIEITEGEIEDIIDSLYIKEKGIVTFLEFEAGVLDKSFFKNEDRLRQFFDYLDLDGNGYIELDEIVNCFKRFGRTLEEKRVTKMIREVDDNSDGKIDFAEFKSLMDLESLSQN